MLEGTCDQGASGWVGDGGELPKVVVRSQALLDQMHAIEHPPKYHLTHRYCFKRTMRKIQLLGQK